MLCGILYKKETGSTKSVTHRVKNTVREVPNLAHRSFSDTLVGMTKLPSPDSSTYVYIVRCADGTLYTGWTVDLQRRIRQHNAGRGARYTRQHGPVDLVYWEVLPNRSAALKREDEIKRRGRTYKERLVRGGAKDG